MKNFALPAVLALTCAITAACGASTVPAAPAPTAPGSGSSSPVSRGCEQFSRHQYEVCYAYLVNDTLLARVPYYEVSRDPVLGPLALTRLKSRFYGAAQRAIIGQTTGWPADVDVSAPSIRIVGPVSVSANLSTATIHTIETWLVRVETSGGTPGRVLFAETGARHTITLHRTPTMLCVNGHCLHKWVVVQIR